MPELIDGAHHVYDGVMLPPISNEYVTTKELMKQPDLARERGYRQMLPDWCGMLNGDKVQVDKLLEEIKQTTTNRPFHFEMNEREKNKRNLLHTKVICN